MVGFCRLRFRFLGVDLMMRGLRTLPSGSLFGGVHGEQTMGLKWLSSSEMLSLLSGLIHPFQRLAPEMNGVNYMLEAPISFMAMENARPLMSGL